MKNKKTVVFSALTTFGLIGAFLYITNFTADENNLIRPLASLSKTTSINIDSKFPQPETSHSIDGEKLLQSDTLVSSTKSVAPGLENTVPPALANLSPPELIWDKHGQLVPDFSSRDWIEFFRSVPTEQQQQALAYQSAILEQLSPDQRAQLEQLVATYKNLMAEEHSIRQEYNSYGVDQEIQLAMQGKSADELAWSKVKEMVEQQQHLRQVMLGLVLANAWFETDNAVENYTIAALEIARNPDMEEEQKAINVSQLDYLLPEHMIQSIRASRQSSNIADEVTKWQMAGWSEAKITQALSDQYGQEFASNWGSAEAN